MFDSAFTYKISVKIRFLFIAGSQFMPFVQTSKLYKCDFFVYIFKKIIDKSIIINYNKNRILTFISYERGYYMGNFFTSIQIHNPEQLSKEQFIELFCNKMKENGFVVGNEDDHEISYALAFADNSNWVAVGSESYEAGNTAVQKDAGNIAKMLNACCINVTGP